MALHPSNVKFNNNKLLRGNSQGNTTAAKSKGTMQGADLKSGHKVTISTLSGDVTWEGVIGTLTGILWSFDVKNTSNNRPVTVSEGLSLTESAEPTEDVTVTVTSPTDTGSTPTTGVNIEPVP